MCSSKIQKGERKKLSYQYCNKWCTRTHKSTPFLRASTRETENDDELYIPSKAGLWGQWYENAFKSNLTTTKKKIKPILYFLSVLWSRTWLEAWQPLLPPRLPMLWSRTWREAWQPCGPSACPYCGAEPEERPGNPVVPPPVHNVEQNLKRDLATLWSLSLSLS